MQLIVGLAAIAVVLLVVGLIVTAIKWLVIIAAVVGVVAIAQFYRKRLQ